MQHPDDRELMARVRAGDLDALAALFRRHHHRVRALCYRMTGNADAADDLCQESFLRVLRYAASFDGRASFATWLHRVVRNRCLDHLAAERRDQRALARLADDTADADRAPDPDPERGARLRRALARLSPEKREVLVLSRFENLRYREIAEVCGISVESVKVRAHRALRELRRLFDDLEPDV